MKDGITAGFAEPSMTIGMAENGMTVGATKNGMIVGGTENDMTVRATESGMTAGNAKDGMTNVNNITTAASPTAVTGMKCSYNQTVTLSPWMKVVVCILLCLLYVK